MAEHMENGEKKRGVSKPMAAGIVAAAVVVGVIGVRGVSSNNKKNAQAAQITSETVTTGDVVKTVTGTGVLTADTTSKVTAPIGLKVTEVYVAKGDKVKKGDKIAKVSSQSVNEQLLNYKQKIDTLNDEIDELDGDDKNYELEKQVKLGQIDEYNDEIKVLTKLQKDKYVIKSNADGIVDAVNMDEGKAITQSYSAPDAPDGSSTQNLISSFMQGAVEMPSDVRLASLAERTVLLLSEGEDDIVVPAQDPAPDAPTADLPEPPVTDTPEAQAQEPVVGETLPQTTAPDEGGMSETKPSSGGDEKESETETQGDVILSGSIPVGIIPPITGTKPQTSLGAIGDLFDADITWDLDGDTFEANKSYTAKITLRARDGVAFSDDFGITVGGAAVTEQVKEKGLRVYSAAFPQTSRSIEDLTQEELEQLAKIMGVSVKELLGSGMDLSSLAGGINLSGLGGFNLSGLSGGLDMTSLGASSQTSSGSSTEAVVLTVLSADHMKLEIEVDELDILSVSEGQEANITIDALGDTEQFQGKITKISDIATSGSNSSKYTVSVEVPKTDAMKFGMSAKAVIEVEHREDVLTLSMDAVQSANGVNYVYTTIDKDGNLAGEQEVVTGVSDESTVEIISGVAEGTEVYYKDLSNRFLWNNYSMGIDGGDEE